MRHPEIPLAPLYINDLRQAIQESFASDAPVLIGFPWRGEISSRISAYRRWRSRSIEEQEPALPMNSSSFGKRYQLTAMQKPLIHATLLDIAASDTDLATKIRAERRVLRGWAGPQLRVPLSPALLEKLERGTIAAPSEFTAWFDRTLHEFMAMTSLSGVQHARKALRLKVLIRGAEGRWHPETVSAAELFIDILSLCKAAELDVSRACTISDEFGGSIAAALEAIDADQDTSFEKLVPCLARPALTVEDLPKESADMIRAFALARLGAVRTAAPAGGHVKIAADPPPGSETPQSDPASEDPRKLFEHIRAELAARVCGDRGISSLALVGVAHMTGAKGQRVLISGQSGSGKTFTARCFAEILGIEFQYLDLNDVTATGWQGAEITSIVEDLDRQSKNAKVGGLLLVDEVDKARVRASTGSAAYNAKTDLMASLLGLFGGQPVTPSGGGPPIATDGILVIGCGAFGGRFVDRPPTTEDLRHWGFTLEFAARFTTRIAIRNPTRDEAVDLLRRSDRSVARALAPLAASMGIELDVPESVLNFVAERWLSSGADFRTASEWILSAARSRLIRALEDGFSGRLTVAPDDL